MGSRERFAPPRPHPHAILARSLLLHARLPLPAGLLYAAPRCFPWEIWPLRQFSGPAAESPPGRFRRLSPLASSLLDLASRSCPSSPFSLPRTPKKASSVPMQIGWPHAALIEYCRQHVTHSSVLRFLRSCPARLHYIHGAFPA